MRSRFRSIDRMVFHACTIHPVFLSFILQLTGQSALKKEERKKERKRTDGTERKTNLLFGNKLPN
jgi:uncharacterized damage-inducible protein DinB